jgi:hypothetical protein
VRRADPRLVVALAALAIAGMCPDVSARPRPRVVVFPQAPGVRIGAAERVVSEAGFELVSFAPLRRRLIDGGERAAAEESSAIGAVERALAAARAAYLEQRFDAMVATLIEAETSALRFLAQPRHAATLWELEFQIGLAELSRQRPDAARSRFALALELDPERSPRRELYGPDVVRAYAEAVDARALVAARPAPLAIAPADALVVIDGTPVVDNARPRDVRAGLHVVTASAPGHQTHAAILDLAPGDPIEIELASAPGEAIDRVAASWSTGGLDPTSMSGRRAIAATLGNLGATAALVISADRGHGEAAALVITGEDATPPQRRSSSAAAARAALALLRRDGTLVAADAQRRSSSNAAGGTSVFGRWWFWTAVGAAAVAVGVGIGIAALTPEDRLLLLSPRPDDRPTSLPARP